MKTSAALLSACPAAAEITTVDGDYAAGNYFEITSENYLGTKQHYQFQPEEIKGTVTENDQQVTYHWGSKCSGSVGNCDASASSSYSSSLAAMPRGYISIKYGGYYTWYAATAEKGKASTPLNAVISDSLCPSGWKLPGSSGNGSFYDLIIDKYQYVSTPGPNNSAAEKAIRKQPMNIIPAGRYTATVSNTVGRDGNYWLSHSSASYAGSASTLDFTRDGAVYPTYDHNKAYGMSIRCVHL